MIFTSASYSIKFKIFEHETSRNFRHQYDECNILYTHVLAPGNHYLNSFFLYFSIVFIFLTCDHFKNKIYEIRIFNNPIDQNKKIYNYFPNS